MVHICICLVLCPGIGVRIPARSVAVRVSRSSLDSRRDSTLVGRQNGTFRTKQLKGLSLRLIGEHALPSPSPTLANETFVLY